MSARISRILFQFALVIFPASALCEGVDEKECEAIIKKGTPQHYVDFCIWKFYSDVVPGGGSSTSNEKEKVVSIIRDQDGRVFSLTPLDSAVVLPDRVKTLTPTTIPDQNKLGVQFVQKPALEVQLGAE